MESAILIAIISAVGVVGTSFIQWRINARTVKSNETSLEKEREYRAEQSIREADERRQIRKEEREAELTRAKAADQALWLEKRQELHESAIANLPGLITEAKMSVIHIKTLRGIKSTRGATNPFDSKVKAFSELYRASDNVLLEMESKLELYGSDESSDSYSQTVAQMARLAIEIDMLYWSIGPADKERVSMEEQQAIEETLGKLESAYERYVAAARSDLRTDQ